MPSDNVQHELQRCSLTKMGEIAPHTQHTLYTNTKKRTANSSSCDDRLDLDIEPTNGQPASCRARPVNIDDRLVDIMWIRQWPRRRDVADGVLRSLPKPEKCCFLPIYGERGIEIICRLFSTHQPTIHLRSRHIINPRWTRFLSGKASENIWPPRK